MFGSYRGYVSPRTGETDTQLSVDPLLSPPADVASGGGTLRPGSSIDADSIDPAVAFIALFAQLLRETCVQLVKYPDESAPVGFQPIPEVAQSLPVRSAGGRTYTFRIRAGFRFSQPNNPPVTGRTVKDSIERTLHPRMKSPAAQFLADVVGAGAYMAGKANDCHTNSKSVTAGSWVNAQWSSGFRLWPHSRRLACASSSASSPPRFPGSGLDLASPWELRLLGAFVQGLRGLPRSWSRRG